MSWRGLLVAAALACPSAAAAFVGPLSFSAESLVVTGATTLEGRLAAFEAFTSEAPTPGWALRLDGVGRLDVDREHRLEVGNMYTDYGRPEESETILTNGEWRGQPRANESFVFVRDLPGHPPPAVLLNPLSTRLAPPPPGCVEAKPEWASMKVPDCREVASSTAGLDSRGRVEVRIRGAFQFAIWGWLLENGTRSLVTGNQEGEPLQDLVEVDTRPTNRTSAFAVYQDGALSLVVDAESLRNLFIEGLRVSTDGVVLAQDTRDLLTRQPNGDLQLEGGTTLAVRPEQARLAVAVVEHGTMAVLTPSPSPEAAAVAVQPTAGDGAPPWPLLAASLLLAALVAAALLRWRRASTPLSRISRALDKGRHEQALAAAASSGLPAGSRHILEAIALIKAGRLDEAEALVADPASALDAAARHYLLATVAAGREDGEAARRHLDACFRHDPAYRLEAAMNSRLRPFLDLDGPAPGRGKRGGPAVGREGADKGSGPDWADPAGGPEAYA